MARRSFVPTDIFWGYQFVDIIVRPAPGETRYSIDLNRFHDIVPQAGLPPLPASALSRLVTNRAKRTVPYPLLGDNTLVVSDTMCLYRDEAGRLCLAARVADTYPNQMIEITAKMSVKWCFVLYWGGSGGKEVWGGGWIEGNLGSIGWWQVRESSLSQRSFSENA